MKNLEQQITEINIQRYRELLKAEADASRLQTLAHLLAEEEAKMAQLLARQREHRK